jgi:signal transduction histidine kinase
MVEPVNFLIVDDLEENLLSLEALLQRDGLRFLKARSGEEALEALLKHDVALALLDVQMPGMDGFQLAEYMRGSERARHIPIIFLTAGSADRQRRFRGYEAGAVDFIQKPIEPDVLRGKANVFFDLYRQRQQIAAQRDVMEEHAAALRAADRNKNRFIAILGHELRNPVMALGAGLRLLKRADAERAADIQQKMERQVAHLARLIEDLLDISRIDQGKISLKMETVELAPILTAAIEASQPMVEGGGHNLKVDIPAEPVRLRADGTRLAQVVSNLLNNAAKYTPPGGRIGLGVRRGGVMVEIAVTDNGVGIPADMQSRIFEIFTQAPGEDGLPQDGLGIGLALVKQLVELHGGAIEVASGGAGEGSRFTVRLPIETGEGRPAETSEVSLSA